MKFLFNANAFYFNFGLLLLRIGLGFSYMYNHGFAKISHPEKWQALGEKMSLLHIHFVPAFWGFMAAFSEFFGGLFLLLGLFSRIACILLGFTMFVAFLTGFTKNEFNSAAFEMMTVFIALLFTGPGKYSLDARISGFKY